MIAAVTLLVGTTKGAFLLEAGPARRDWTVRGPFCDGWPINHEMGDPKTGTLWAAGGGEWPGAGVWRSDDGGETWTLSKLANGRFDAWLAKDPDMAEQLGVSADPPAPPHIGEIDAIWSLGRRDGALDAGAKPAALFASADRGTTWARVQGLTDHPSADG